MKRERENEREDKGKEVRSGYGGIEMKEEQQLKEKAEENVKGKGNSRRRGRSLKGGNIIDDIQTFGRDIVYRMGSAVNGVSGYDNSIYNVNPNPTFQFPRGLGNVTTGASSYNTLDLQKIYDNSYRTAATL